MQFKNELLNKIIKGRYFAGVATALALFFLLLPLSLKIDFMQNDDWVYYGMVENFMKLDFRMDPLSAPTFYTQGVMGLLFARVFGLERLPVLTLIVSVLCFFFLFVILLKHFYLDTVGSGSRKSTVLYVVFIFLALNIRQVALVLPLSALIYSFFKLDRKQVLLNLIILAGLGI